MTTVTTTTVTPAAPAPQVAYPVAAPAVPGVASSYTTGASLPQYGSLSTLIPAPVSRPLLCILYSAS